MDLTVPPAVGLSARNHEPKAMRVLVVDDDSHDAYLIGSLLTEADPTTRFDTVQTTAEATRAILSGVYDAYLVDYRLGPDDGIALIEATRGRASGPFVLMTGIANDDLDEMALTAGATDCLEKMTLTSRTLRKSLRNAIRTWNAEQGAARHQEAEDELAVTRSILNQVPVGIIQTDNDGMVTGWNRQAEIMYGWSRQEALGRRALDLTVPDGSLGQVAEILDAILNEGTWQGELIARRKDGSTLPVYVRQSTTLDEGGARIGAVGVVQDMSDLRSARDALDLRIAQQAALAAISRLAVDIHEIDAFLDKAIHLIAETMHVDTVGILELDRSTNEFFIRAETSVDELDKARRIPAGAETLAGLTLATGPSVVAEDVAADPRLTGDENLARLGSRSSVTGLIGNGSPWGVLAVHSKVVRHFSHDDVYFVESAANLVAAVVDRAQADDHRNRLAEILESTTDFVGTADTKGRVLYANRASLMAAGLVEGDDTTGLGIDAFQPPWAVEIIEREGIPSALANGLWSGRTAFLDPLRGEVPTSQVIIAHPPRGGGGIVLSTVARDLTETLDAERRLGESQTLVGKAFHEATVGKAILDLDGRFTSVNQSLAGFLGYEPADLIGLHHREVTHPDDLELGDEEIRQIRAGLLDDFHMQKRYLRPDGSTVWGLVHLSSIPGSDALPELFFAQVVDIDARRNAEEQIRFQASLLDHVHNAVVATDLQGNVIFWNRFAETMFGRSAEEALGKELFPLIAPDADRFELMAMVSESLLTDGKWEGEGTLARKDGTRFPAYMSDSVLRDGEGVPIGVVGIKIDLTETKRAETLARKQGEMAESVLRSVRFPVAVLDQQGMITAVNHAWSRFAVKNGGSPVATGVGVDYLEVCRRAGDDVYAVAALRGITDVLDESAEDFTLDYPCPEADGTERWFELDVTPMVGGGAVVTHWNITDELAARIALEETIRAKDQFIASLSHELRTPLTAIMGLAQELRDGAFSPGDTNEFHQIIAEQSQEVSLLVEDLLVAARIESDTLTLKLEEMDVTQEIERVLAPWRSRGLTEVAVSSSDAVSIRSDPGRFRQIIRNLILNAFRHGAEPFEIHVSRLPGSVRVTVTDRGPGVPPHALNQMFQPYAAFAQETGQPASVGLGLHVSRGLAERLGGTLTYHRDRDITIFELRVPTWIDADSPIPESPTQRSPARI